MKCKLFPLFMICSGILLSGYTLHAQEHGRRFTADQVQVPLFKKDTFNILRYGAKKDGVTLNTQSINKAIDVCSKNGGGVVLVPAGLWLTGPVVFKSNVNLHLLPGALLQFTDDLDQYPLVQSNYEGVKAVRCQSPLTAQNLENIAITGSGVIDGNGDAWRMVKKGKLTASEWEKLVASGGILSDDQKSWYPSEKSMLGAREKDADIIDNRKTIQDYEAVKDFLRPNLLRFFNCKKVLLQGVIFENSPAWCLHPLLCEDVTVSGITVRNPLYAQNGDGIDLESCKNAVIENSVFSTGDDAICIKSGKNEEGRKRGMPTENVIIRNCVAYHAHGGFVIGSEMSGGVRNIYVTNCVFIGSDNGLRFKTTRGRGGVVENIYVSHISMKDIVHNAILFDMYYGKSGKGSGQDKVPPVTAATPQFRNFYVQDIVCNGAETGVFLRGLPEMNVQDIYFDNLVLKTTSGISCTEGKNISFKQVRLITGNAQPEIRLENCSNITFGQLGYTAGKTVFSIAGEKSRGIKVSGTDMSRAQQKASFSNGAGENALVVQ